MDNYNTDFDQEQTNGNLVAGAELLQTITDGDFVLQVIITNVADEPIHQELDGVMVFIEPHAGVNVASLRGSKENLSTIWQMVEIFGQALSEKIAAGNLKEDEIPMLEMRLYPIDRIEGVSYAGMAFPQFWAFSGDGYGLPADHIQIAFPDDLCNVYFEEDETDGKVADQPETNN